MKKTMKMIVLSAIVGVVLGIMAIMVFEVGEKVRFEQGREERYEKVVDSYDNMIRDYRLGYWD